jgi:hypothetical protein
MVEHIERVRRLARGQEGWSQLCLTSATTVLGEALLKAHTLQAIKVRPGQSIPDPKLLRVWAEEACDAILADPEYPDGHGWRMLAEFCTDLIRTHVLEAKDA